MVWYEDVQVYDLYPLDIKEDPVTLVGSLVTNCRTPSIGMEHCPTLYTLLIPLIPIPIPYSSLYVLMMHSCLLP